MSYHDIIRDEPPLNKNTLITRNNRMHKSFKYVSDSLGDKFIQSISKTNKTEVTNRFSFVFFRN